MRYNRVYTQLVPHPPLDSDRKCYLSHTGDAIYWLGQMHDKEQNNKVVSNLVVFNIPKHFHFKSQEHKRQEAKNMYKVHDLTTLKLDQN
jgi:hypothetical protein